MITARHKSGLVHEIIGACGGPEEGSLYGFFTACGVRLEQMKHWCELADEPVTCRRCDRRLAAPRKERPMPLSLPAYTDEQVEAIQVLRDAAWEAVIEYFVHDNLEPDTQAQLREAVQVLDALALPGLAGITISGMDYPEEWDKYQVGIICPACGEHDDRAAAMAFTREARYCPTCAVRNGFVLPEGLTPL